MSGKPRTVYLYEPYYEDPKGNILDAPEDIWSIILDAVDGLDKAARTKSISNTHYRGATRETVTPAVRYLYIGKRRDQSDWPDHTPDGETDEGPLAVPGELVEPTYLRPMTGTNYVAILRTSAGPLISAVSTWIHQVIQPQNGLTFHLRPKVRRDALERLTSADEVGRIELQISEFADLDHLDDGAKPTSLTEAAKKIKDAGGENAAVTLTLSYGFGSAEAKKTPSLIQGLERLINRGGVRRAKASVRERQPDGKLKTGYLDFFNDQIAQKVTVGKSRQDSQTPEVVMTAMGEAIEKFRANLDVIRKGGVVDGTDDEERDESVKMGSE
ncbi:hypothetical protein [Gordonia malaquae]|uniref:hypothetical protein n=1 Tax=Gordonia malaquae TaxID=410332 RepID=UPI0030FE7E5D